MRDLERALTDIRAMRSQIARGTEFRGYGPATVAATGLLALLAGAVQAVWIPDPGANILGYLALWTATAAVSFLLIGIEMISRSRRIHSGLADEMILAAIEQFTPAGVAGILLTFVLWRFAPHALWMLPGLWQIIFSLGIFPSCRSLPRPMFAAGIWYLASGLACLAMAADARTLSPWAMAVPFGIGQFAMALIFHFSSGADDAEA